MFSVLKSGRDDKLFMDINLKVKKFQSIFRGGGTTTSTFQLTVTVKLHTEEKNKWLTAFWLECIVL